MSYVPLKVIARPDPLPVIKILVLEDQPTDFELEQRAIRRGGLDCIASRVDSMPAFVNALQGLDPDVIIVDYQVPGFDGLEATRVAKQHRPDIPVLLVTGVLTDDAAVNAFKAGITDYVLKDRLARLPVAISRALEEAARVRQRQVIEAERNVLIRIMECTDSGIIGCSLDGTIIAWNSGAAGLYRWAESKPVGQAISAVLGTAYTSELDAALRRVGNDHIALSLEQELRGEQGDTIVLSLSLSPISDAEETTIGVSMIVRDVTEQKRVQQQLQQARDEAELASQAKSRFLALITHELRTPLHGILGYAELLILEGNLDARQSERLECMMTAGEYLLGMINAVLDMSQIEAERLELSPIVIDVPELVRTCLDVIRPAADAKGLALVAAPTAPSRLLADANRLRQVLLNLLGNAVKFTTTGTVELRLRPIDEGRWLRFEVVDTGPGIWPRHREKLFRMFERLNAKAVAGIEGAGLGLALTAKLIQLMGGRIGYADNLDGGSVFWVELPCGDVSSAEAEVAKRTPAAAGSATLRVLLADDDSLNRSIASRFLDLAGHEVMCVDSGTSAVHAASTQNFDVILMDVRMPGMDGLEATRRIRALPGPRRDVPILAVTAHAFAEQILVCENAGMDGHVSKPFKQATLLAAVTGAVIARSDRRHGLVQEAAADMLGDPEAPMLDRAIFAEIRAALPPAVLALNLGILIEEAEALVHGLQGSDVRSRAKPLAMAAHKLAGGFGTCGFLFVATKAREFESAVDSGAPDMEELADQLTATFATSLGIVRAELAGMVEGSA